MDACCRNALASESNASAFSVGVVAAPESEKVLTISPLLDDADNRDDADRQLRPLPPLPLLQPMTATVGNSMSTSCRCRTIVRRSWIGNSLVKIFWFFLLWVVGESRDIYLAVGGGTVFLSRLCPVLTFFAKNLGRDHRMGSTLSLS